MKDSFVGDVGDYGKYGLLRIIEANGLTLSVNWYRTAPESDINKGYGKYTDYLNKPDEYWHYDPELFDCLYSIVNVEKDRRIERIENSGIINASFYGSVISDERTAWHKIALEELNGTQVIFLDPDNGIESESMRQKGKCPVESARAEEIRDYFDRGQNVIVYHHRPQRMKKDQCVKNVVEFMGGVLGCRNNMKVLEFPKYTNRFYFMFLHPEYKEKFDIICREMTTKWDNGFCLETAMI